MAVALGRESGPGLETHDVHLGLRQTHPGAGHHRLAHARTELVEVPRGVLQRAARIGRCEVPMWCVADAHPPARHRAQRQLDARERADEKRCIVHRAREHACGVQRGRERFDARHRQKAEGGLVADHAAVSRGPDHRGSRLGAEGQRHHAGGHRRGRAAGGAARCARCIGAGARVARDTGLEGGELGGHCLAHDHTAGLAHAGDHGGVHHRAVPRVDRRAVGGGHVGGVDQVLHGDRHAGQGALRACAVERLRLRDHLCGVEMLPGQDAGLPRLDALDERPRHRLRADLAPRNAPCDLARGPVFDLLHAHAFIMRTEQPARQSCILRGTLRAASH
ncbi:hypothetical protein FQZ97_871160 [compost metagenome]